MEHRNFRVRRWLVTLSAVVLMWFAVMMMWLPREDSITGRFDGIVVLSSGLNRNGLLNANGEARLRRGLQVAATGGGAVLYTTRVRRNREPRITSDSGQKHIVDSARYTGKWVTTDGIALTTRDEAERVKRLLPEGKIALVTTRLHTRRACATFEHLGYDVTCVSSGVEAPLWLAPYFALYESAAIVKYRMKGWI